MAKKDRATADLWCESSVLDAVEAAWHAKPDAWVFLRQVPDGTSVGKSRTADGMAFGCWNSVGGNVVHGYEVKTARSDWIREMQQAEKSSGFNRQTHYWWIVAPEGVVKLEELPAEWGLKIVRKNGVGQTSGKIARPATMNKEAQMGYGMICAVVRRAWRSSTDRAEQRRAVEAAFTNGRESAFKAQQSSESEELRRRSLEVERLKGIIADFEAASGLMLGNWTSAKIGKAVRVVMSGGSAEDHWRMLLSASERAADQARKAIATMAEPRAVPSQPDATESPHSTSPELF